MLFAILQKYDFSSKSQLKTANNRQVGVVCDTAKVRFFKQITTFGLCLFLIDELFAILQKYDFSSKSQLGTCPPVSIQCCLRYCKSTIFQANHNTMRPPPCYHSVVCDTAKVRFFKQITTNFKGYSFGRGCLRYCKSTIFQANHNCMITFLVFCRVVCDTAKVRFFKQITTEDCQ